MVTWHGPREAVMSVTGALKLGEEVTVGAVKGMT